MDFSLKDLSYFCVNDLTENNFIIAGLDIGDKRVGVSISDRRIKIASALEIVERKNIDNDYLSISTIFKKHNVGLAVFGWPVQMNGIPGLQCQKNLEFVRDLSNYIDIDFAKWDERFSTIVVENVLIEANISRKKRKKVIDKSAAVYILQGAIDFLNRSQ